MTVDPDSTEIMGAEYKLEFDNSLLKALSQNKGSFLSQDGASTIPIVGSIDNAAGRVEYGEMRTPGPRWDNHYGTLATIEFEVRCYGVDELRLYDVILSDPDAQEILGFAVSNANVEIAQQPSIPFLICGYVFNDGGSGCNDPAVNITNLNK